LIYISQIRYIYKHKTKEKQLWDADVKTKPTIKLQRHLKPLVVKNKQIKLLKYKKERKTQARKL